MHISGDLCSTPSSAGIEQEGEKGEGRGAGESGSYLLADVLRSGRRSKNGCGGGSESSSLDGSVLSSWAMSALQQGRNKYRQAMGLAPQDISSKDLSSPHGTLSPPGLHPLSILGGEEAEILKKKKCSLS
jgi:hypothetical protein